MLNSPHAGLCCFVLNSLESRPLFDYPKQSTYRPFWIKLNSIESRPLLGYAKQSTCRPLLDCAKKSGKQTFDGLS